MRQIVFVSSNGLVEPLTVGKSAEVERTSPAVLVEIGGKVVIVPGQSGILCFPCLVDV